MLTETSLHDREAHPHLWGGEEWIVNNDKYCGKILYINKGYQSSLHFHPVKDETMLCVAGQVWLEYWVDTLDRPPHLAIMRGWARDAVGLPPGTPHRFSTPERGGVLIEFSTKHNEKDVVRIEKAKWIG